MRQTLIALALLFALPAFAQDPTPRPAAADAPPAEQVPPEPVAVTPAPSNPPMTGPKLLISTTMGDITLQLDDVRAPKSVANVLGYVRRKHYDGTVFYRVAKGFVIQMGSWEANGKGRGVSPAPIPLEANNGLSNLRGTVGLGREEAPDSAKAEFYINVSDNTALDHKPEDPGNTTGYAVFGQVISGMEVVDAINNVPVGDNGPMPGQAPITPILVKRVSIIK
jgi:peptidyl-prolyl cis-trans isomerase A (cyclophilin A)/peptidyl-prolyl cis-trans isomerase B (cyclophilin B)